MTLEERFWSKVARCGFDECWPWQASVDKDGYGRFRLDSVSTAPANRVAFFLVHGRWPEPHALHGCDNPPCCNAENPEHIHEGTPKLNAYERAVRGRFVLNLTEEARRRAQQQRRVFSDAQVLSFRSRRAAGEAVASLAEETGVAYETMRLLLLGLSYADVGRSLNPVLATQILEELERLVMEFGDGKGKLPDSFEAWWYDVDRIEFDNVSQTYRFVSDR